MNEISCSKTTMNSVNRKNSGPHSLSPATSTMMLAAVVACLSTMTGTVHGAYDNGLVDHLVPVDYVVRVKNGAGGAVDKRRSMQTSDNVIEYNDDAIEEYDPDIDFSNPNVEGPDPDADHIRDPNAPTNNYFIPDPEIFFCDLSASFVMRFQVSDYLLNEQFRMDMLLRDDAGEFTVDITNNTYLTPGLEFDGTPPGNGDWYRQVAISFEADSKMLPLSPIFYTGEEGSDENPYINFNSRLYLYGRDGKLVNWIDVEYFLMLELSKQSFFDDRRLQSHLSSGNNFDSEVGHIGYSHDVQSDSYGEEKAKAHRQSSASLSDFNKDQDQSALFTVPTMKPSNKHSNSFFVEHKIQFNEWEGIPSHRRRLLNCFDGFTVVFDVGIRVPTESPAPSMSPAPTTTTSKPTPAPAIVIGEPTETVMQYNNTEIYRYGQEQYGAFGYLCNEELEPLSLAEQAVVIVQGDSLVRVCVERKEKCVEQGIFLRWIDGFSFFREDTNARQVAVKPINQPSDDGFTEVSCESGSHKCWFETFLLAKFFTSPGEVKGVGVASLQFGDGRRRDLQNDSGDRPGPEEVEETKGFQMTFSITTDEFLQESIQKYTDRQGEKSKGIEKTVSKKAALLSFVVLFVCLLGVAAGFGWYQYCRRPVTKSSEDQTSDKFDWYNIDPEDMEYFENPEEEHFEDPTKDFVSLSSRNTAKTVSTSSTQFSSSSSSMSNTQSCCVENQDHEKLHSRNDSDVSQSSDCHTNQVKRSRRDDDDNDHRFIENFQSVSTTSQNEGLTPISAASESSIQKASVKKKRSKLRKCKKKEKISREDGENIIRQLQQLHFTAASVNPKSLNQKKSGKLSSNVTRSSVDVWTSHVDSDVLDASDIESGELTLQPRPTLTLSRSQSHLLGHSYTTDNDLSHSLPNLYFDPTTEKIIESDLIVKESNVDTEEPSDVRKKKKKMKAKTKTKNKKETKRSSSSIDCE